MLRVGARRFCLPKLGGYGARSIDTSSDYPPIPPPRPRPRPPSRFPGDRPNRPSGPSGPFGPSSRNQPPPPPEPILSLDAADQLPKGPPLNTPLPGVNLPPPLPDYVQLAETEVTTFANGLTIASENIPGPTMSVGLFINCGSVYELPATLGACHVLERMAYKSTKNRTQFRLLREVEAIGGNVMASASREQMAYTGDAIKTYMPHIAELIMDNVRNAIFYQWEVNEQAARIQRDINEVAKSPQSLLLEGLHSAGFSGGLSQPLLATESALPKLTGEVLSKFIHEHYTAPRMVLAASGVDHKELVSVVEPVLSDLPEEELPPVPESSYVGGDWRRRVDSPITHVGIAFEVCGGWRGEHDAIALSVLQNLLGSGGQSSTGGPGKDVHSRLYRISNEHPEVQSITAFNNIYNDTGIFGIYGVTGSGYIGRMIDLVCLEFQAIATPGNVSDIEFYRAKTSSKAAVLMNLESRAMVTEDIGRQILTYGHRKPVQEFIDGLNKLTLEDIHAIAEKVIATPLTLGSWGDVARVPKYDIVAARFRMK